MLATLKKAVVFSLLLVVFLYVGLYHEVSFEEVTDHGRICSLYSGCPAFPVRVSKSLTRSREFKVTGKNHTIGMDEYLKTCSRLDNWKEAATPEIDTFQGKLKEYMQFHSQQLKLVQSGALHPSKLRTLVVSCPNGKYCAGLGDQIARVEVALLLAMISNRVFGIHWDSITMQSMKYLEPHVIRWDQVVPSVGETKSIFGRTQRTKKNNGIIKNKLYSLKDSEVHITLTMETVVSMPEALDYLCEDDYHTMKLLHDVGLLEDSRTGRYKFPIDAVKSLILQYLFKFSSQLLNKVKKIEREVGLNKPYIGLHLRTGFIGNEFEEEFFPKFVTRLLRDNTSWANALDCSVKLANSMQGHESLIYLATDSYLVKNLAREKYPGHIVTLDMKLLHVGMVKIEKNPSLRRKFHMEHANTTLTREDQGASGTKEDQGASGTKEDQGASGAEEVDGWEGMWVDFLLLARSHAMVRTTSGFSAVAANICFMPPSKVFLTTKCAPDLPSHEFCHFQRQQH